MLGNIPIRPVARVPTVVATIVEVWTIFRSSQCTLELNGRRSCREVVLNWKGRVVEEKLGV